MASFPSGCAGSSRWVVDIGSGRWFPAGIVGPTAGCVVASFTFNGTPIDNDKGLSPAEHAALRQKFGDVIREEGNNVFIVPLVPAGTQPFELGP